MNELIAKNKFLLPFLTTSDDDKSSLGSFNIQDSKLDVFLKQIGLSEHKIIGDDDTIEMQERFQELSDMSSKENIAMTGRNSKNSNRSIGSKKSLKTGNSSRLRKTRKSSRSIGKTANPLAITNGSGRLKNDKKAKEKEKRDSMAINGNFQGSSSSGRSDVGIQTDNPSELSSMEFAERMMKQDQGEEDYDEPMESHKLLPKRVSLSAATKRRDTNENLLSESEKLKLLLLPSK